MNDKPSIVARDAQEAAAAAKQAADGLSALPTSPTRDTLLKVLGGVTTVGGIVATALIAGTVPAFVAGGVGIVTWLAGLFHTTPSK